MNDRMVAYSITADAEASADVVKRLAGKGVDIIDQQPHALLLSGDREAIGQALDGARGWRLGAETKVPPPKTRQRVLRRP